MTSPPKMNNMVKKYHEAKVLDFSGPWEFSNPKPYKNQKRDQE
jgi:hypothetical protein